ncbi:MAG: hypothetical protein ACD_22C00138G0003 [uncultured bacterium]|nr:MAG: hypothetical protein ACD_22C00138G0003 [uncultured bacterium]
MLLPIAIFVFGLILLLICTEILVKNAETLAYKLKLSPLIVGLTIVAIGTSIPELIVSTFASVNHDYGLALGNIVGSNIVNILLILPIAILLGKLRVGTVKTQRSTIVILLITLLFFTLHKLNTSPPLVGIVLLTCAIIATSLEYLWGIEGRDHEDHTRVSHNISKPFGIHNILLLIGALVGVSIGGMVLVQTTELFSEIFGLSTSILGLSLTAIATSLPELLTTIFSQNEHDDKLTIGNIIGSNIYNLALIGGVISFFNTGFDLNYKNWLWFLGATMILALILWFNKGKAIPKYIGVCLLLGFILYMFFLAM